jgi:deferrochelatase/peroxidase EfeB
LIICGHDGDPMGQPEWAKDGSFLVIRELQQKVPEYNQ